ncbi:MAG: M23 family metallopeptidase [Roseburia sp.]|nr:M23 family metallopeptidase [Roseburia sp.]
MKHFVDFNVSTELIDEFYKAAEGDVPQFLSLLTIYMGTDCESSDATELQEKSKKIVVDYAAEYESLYQYIATIFYDMTYFPVGKVTNLPDAEYSYVDSWQFERTYGGDRVHEGCDIMATHNKRGIYPIYSATDGIVENVGWLKLGGWRIGIRSESGAYYYYAHLSEYAKEFSIGETVTAGTLLGFMGDSGYSEVVGTTGMFDVHLHFGIYFDDEFGNEYAINPYPVLYFCEKRQTERLAAAKQP